MKRTTHNIQCAFPSSSKTRENERDVERSTKEIQKKEVHVNLTPPSLEASPKEDKAVAPTNNSISLLQSEMGSSFGNSRVSKAQLNIFLPNI